MAGSEKWTRTVVVRVRGYRTVESVGDIVLAVPAEMSDEEVEAALEDKHDLLPLPVEWEDLDDEADIELNQGIQPFGVKPASSGMEVQDSFFTDEE